MTQQNPQIDIAPLTAADAGEVLTLQRAAFVSEALIYGSPDMPPLTQTLAEVEAELRAGQGLGARIDGRLVGAIRYQEGDGMLLIGRIAIAPDTQGAGIGRTLLDAVEKGSSAEVAELFTGSLSEANIRLYEELGYSESTRVPQGDGTDQVFLRKPLHPVGEPSEPGASG
jgi:predicted N-acetyltransferase YhbS